MNANDCMAGDPKACLESFAAELAAAAYPVALRHGSAGSWLELELDLWRALAETLKKRAAASQA